MKGKKGKIAVFGILIGFINGLFGSGGGMIAVPLIKSFGVEQKEAHINSLAVIFPLCVISSFMYYGKIGNNLRLLLMLIPFGIIGALIGTVVMKKIKPIYLNIVFTLFMVYAAVRMLFI